MSTNQTRQPPGTEKGGQFAAGVNAESTVVLATPETMSIDNLIDQFRADAKKERVEFGRTADFADESGYVIDHSYTKGRCDAFFEAARELRGDKSMSNVVGLISKFTDLSDEAKRKSAEYGTGEDLTDDLDDMGEAARLNGLCEGYIDVVKKLKELR